MMKLSSPGEAFPTDNETEASAALTTKVNFQCLKSFLYWFLHENWYNFKKLKIEKLRQWHGQMVRD